MKRTNKGMTRTVVWGLILILLILVNFFRATIFGQEPQTKKEISVILYHAGTSGWESLQEGLKRAEDDFSVNVNCVILHENADANEQVEAIEREIENGAEGIIVAVVDDESVYDLIREKKITIPIVTVESGFDNNTVSCITADNYEMGKMLGEEILKDFSDREELVVAIDTDSTKRESVEKREKGLRDALEGKAKIISLRIAANGEGADVAVALHKEALLNLAQLNSVSLRRTKRYGIGNSNLVVAALDQGEIEKLVFQNEFNMGYIAVESLLGKIGIVQKRKSEGIDYFCVKKENLFETPYEQLLFPIVK